MLQRLIPRPPTRLSAINKHTLLPRQALIIPEHPQEWQRHRGRDDSKGAKCPSPSSRIVKTLGCRSASKGRYNEGAVGKGKHQTSPFEGRSVGNEDVEDVGDAVEAYPVEDLGCGV